MGKIKIIQKSRKECKCSKCGKVIPVGSRYLRGQLNFSPDIIRCVDCGLKSWEVTTSDYILKVMPLVEEWQEQGYNEETLGQELEEIRDELQERLDNMPDSLQYSDTGQTLQERIDGLDEACNAIMEIDRDSLFEEKVEEVIDREGANAENLTEEETERVNDAVDEEISSLIDDALSNILTE